MCDFKKILLVKPHIPVGVFFIALLVLGISIFNDYGFHWDELSNQPFGHRWASYAFDVGRSRSLSIPRPDYFGSHDFLHGPAFEIFLNALTDICRLKDSRDIILMRHLGVFLLFYVGLIFFYFLCLRHFQDWRLALLGCFFLVLSPRIFADAFYNSVDIAFLSVFIISIFTLVLMLDKRTLLSAVIHALACAILIDIRFIGLFLPVVTLIFLMSQAIRSHTIRDRLTYLGVFTGYLIFLCFLTVLFNPIMWKHPWGSFIEIISYVHFKGTIRTHYMGVTTIDYSSMPWHYTLVWIMVSTPLLYLALLFNGIFASIRLFFKRGVASFQTKRDNAIFLACFFVPLIATTGKLYNGWRHIYFIYPFLVILSITGFQHIWQHIRPLVRGALIIGLIFGSLDTLLFMIRNHPYQNMYFNQLAGRNADEITKRFDLDYWGLSYRKGLEYILKTDRGPIIPVSIDPYDLCVDNIKILPVLERMRLVCSPPEEAEYYLTDRMFVRQIYAGGQYYSIKVDGLKIMVVYKLKPILRIFKT